MVNPIQTRSAVDIGVLVENLERSLAFYRDTLGLPVVGENRTAVIGQGQMMQLRHGASRIKLVQLDETPTQRSPARVASALGYRYITLIVEDIAAVMAQIEQGETAIVEPIRQIGSGALIAMVKDPDGNIVEFVQEAIVDLGGQ